ALSHTEGDSARSFARENAGVALAVFGFDIVGSVDRHDFVFGDDDVKENDFAGLIANAGEIRADEVAFASKRVTRSAVLLEDSVAVFGIGCKGQDRLGFFVDLHAIAGRQIFEEGIGTLLN